jgi:hypothetical protein
MCAIFASAFDPFFPFTSLRFVRCDIEAAIKAIPACDNDKFRDASAMIYQVYQLNPNDY